VPARAGVRAGRVLFRRGHGGYCAVGVPGTGVWWLRPRRPAHRRVPPGRGRYCRLQFV